LLLERAAVAQRLRRARFGKPLSRALSSTQMASLREAISQFHQEVEQEIKREIKAR
jgi:hypothetical protein